jgi:subtilisin family serine protease
VSQSKPFEYTLRVSRRPYAPRLILMAFAASGLIACGGDGAAPAQTHAGEPGAEKTDRDARRVTQQPDVELFKQPSPEQQHPTISTNTIALTLADVPAQLAQKPITDSAWTAWIQEAVGPQGRVLSARMLDPTSVAAPGNGTPIVARVERTSEAIIRELCAHAARAAGIARAEVDPIWSSNAVPSDPEYGKQWHLPRIEAPAAWDVVTGDPNLIVAVLDTGIDLTHPDLVDAIWTNPNDAPDGVDNDSNGLVDDVHGWNFASNDANLKDTSGHGTHVAGLIGAVRNNGVSVAGVASGVKIMPISIGDYAPATAVASAIHYAASHGAKIINMSFGGPETFSGIRTAIDYAVARDVLLVASAHNKSEAGYNYPAVYQDVLAVGATDPDDKRASLSNYGSWVDISAPGQAVVSTVPGGGTLAVSGTSQASPIVAGVAALVKSAHPTWTAEQVRTQLLATADDLNAGNPEYAGLLGAGRVNAARAVGPLVSTSLPYLAGSTSSESTGNGDQQLSPGDTASISVAWRFRSSAGSATARLVSRDPFVTVTSEPVSIAAPRADRTHTARFTIEIAPDTPRDHVAELGALLESSGATAEERIQLPVAPGLQKLKLPFAYEQVLLPHPSGKLFFAADESPYDATRHHRVYAAFRNPDGSFTAQKLLSDPGNHARRPAATVDPNGDVHVVFYQSLNAQEFAAVPGYAKYTAATGEWTRTTIMGEKGIWARLDGGLANSPQPIAIARSPNGELHIAWSYMDELVLTKQVGSEWSEQKVVPFPGDDELYSQLDLEFLTVSGRLMLFAHPVLTRATRTGRDPIHTRKLQVLEYDGENWSAPRELDAGTDTENAQLPSLLGETVYRFQAPVGGGRVSLAELAGKSWEPVREVQDLASAELESSFYGLKTTSGQVTFLSRPVPATRGSTRELWQDGVLTRLPGDSKQRAMYPTIIDLEGKRFIFNQERSIHREPPVGDDGHETFYAIPDHTAFYAPESVATKALPTVPVVSDDGATTSDNRYLHARWSSSHESGIREYRVAWGTAPGLDDIVAWSVTSLAEQVFDLGEQRLLPGQTVYLSVEAQSNAVLSSAMGFSDGITLGLDR